MDMEGGHGARLLLFPGPGCSGGRAAAGTGAAAGVGAVAWACGGLEGGGGRWGVLGASPRVGGEQGGTWRWREGHGARLLLFPGPSCSGGRDATAAGLLLLLGLLLGRG